MSTITTGAAAVPSLSHDWRDQHASWNQGAMDGWLLTHIASDGEANGSFTMGHYTAGRHPVPLGAGQGLHAGGQLPLLGHGPHRREPALLGRGRQRPAGEGGRPGPGDRRRAGPDLRKRARDPLQRRASATSSTRGSAGRRTPSPPTSPSSSPPGRCRSRSTTRCTSTGTLWGERHAGRDRRPGEPDAGQQLGDGLRGGLRQRRAARRVVHRVQVRLRRAPGGHPGGRRPVPRHQAGGAGLQRGAVEQHRVHHQLRRERRVLRPRRAADAELRASTPRSSSRWPRRPAPPAAACRSAPGSGCRPSSSRPGRWAAGSSPKSPTTPPACGSSRRWRRPAACPAPGRSPSPTSAAGGGRPSATGPGPCARARRRRRPRPAPSSTPAPRRPTWPPSRRPRCCRCRRAPARPSSSRGPPGVRPAVSGGRGEGFLLPRPRLLPGNGAGGIVVPETVSHFIGGRHVHSTLRKTYGVTDPATGKEYAQVEVGLGADVNQAVLAARTALETGPWSRDGGAGPGPGPVRYRRRDRRTGGRHRRRRGARSRSAGRPGRGAGRAGGRDLPPRRRADHSAGRNRRRRRAGPVQLHGGASGGHRRADHAVAHAVPGAGAGGRARAGRGLHDRAQAG